MNRIYYLLCLIPAFVLVVVLVPRTTEFLEPQSMCGTVPTPFCGTSATTSMPLTDEQALGKELFLTNCARCHDMNVHKRSTGPALYGVAARVPAGDWIYRYVRDANALVREGDPYAIKVRQKYGASAKDPMPHLSDADIAAIMAWIAAVLPG